jgi:hypothetical protein
MILICGGAETSYFQINGFDSAGTCNNQDGRVVVRVRSDKG